MTGVVHDHERTSCILTPLMLSFPPVTLARFQHVVTTRGAKLMDNQQELRFVSYTIPSLHHIEDSDQLTTPDPWRPPSSRYYLTCCLLTPGTAPDISTPFPSRRRTGDAV